MPQPTVTCYGAVNEIGGNKILLEDGDTRVFFDFGTPFVRRNMYFNEFLNPRPTRGLIDLLSLELLPPLEGLLRDDLAPRDMWNVFRQHRHYRDLRRETARPVDAVLLSHSHLDHIGDVPFIAADMPIITTRTSAVIAKALQVTGQMTFERDLCYINPREPNADGDLNVVKNAEYQGRAFIFLDGEFKGKAAEWWAASPARKRMHVEPCPAFGGTVGSLRVRSWPVDHSLFGAVGFAIETSVGWAAYTGDIRFHGKQRFLMEKFAKDLAMLRPVALLCEGTKIGEAQQVDEAQVYANSLAEIQAARGQLVIADFGPRNVERLLTFLEIARDTGRRLVVLPKDVYLLEAMAWLNADVPGLETHPGISLYTDPKVAPRPWEQDIRRRYGPKIIRPADISANPGGLILCFSLWDINDLLDVRPDHGVYIYSSSKAYDDEQKVDLERLRNWTKHFGLTMRGDPDIESGFHSSGHATGTELLEFIRDVRPKQLIPIHTEHPEYFRDNLAGQGIAVMIPSLGDALALSS